MRKLTQDFLSIDLGEVNTWKSWKLNGWNFHGVPSVAGCTNLVLTRVTLCANYCKQYLRFDEMGYLGQATSLNEP